MTAAPRELWLALSDGEVVIGGFQNYLQRRRYVNVSGNVLVNVTHWRVRDSVESKALLAVFERHQAETRGE